MYPKTRRYARLPLNDGKEQPDEPQVSSVARFYFVSLHIIILVLVWILVHGHWERQFLKLHMLPSEFRKTASHTICINANIAIYSFR